jgi:hypothetical protein
MAKEENETIVHRFVEEVMNGGNLDAAEDLIAPTMPTTTRRPPKSRPAPRASSS